MFYQLTLNKKQKEIRNENKHTNANFFTTVRFGVANPVATPSEQQSPQPLYIKAKKNNKNNCTHFKKTK